jgi:hypothetical protein
VTVPTERDLAEVHGLYRRFGSLHRRSRHCCVGGSQFVAEPEGYVFSDPSRSHRFVFVDQAAEDIYPANAWHLG